MLSLLQAAASLLVSAQSEPSLQAKIAAVHIGSKAVQTVVQETADIPFAITPNDSAAPTAKEVVNAPYRDAFGKWTKLGSSVKLMEQYLSFGDLNYDGSDDAAVVVNKPDAKGGAHYFLAAMLNQGGIMFDIAEAPLGSTINITNHRVASGEIVLDGAHYELLGEELLKK